jgi:2-iminobutanoate/2-iminopropanoate deaminase
MNTIHSTSKKIERITCQKLTKPLPIYSHATIYDNVVYVSGVQGFVPGTFTFPPGGVVEEAKQMMENLQTILRKANTGLKRILKMNLFFSNMAEDFLPVNDAIGLYIPDNSPARSSLGVAALPRDAKVIIDCIVATG